MQMREAWALERPSKLGNKRPAGYVGTHKTGTIAGLGHGEFHRVLAKLQGKRAVFNRRKTGETDVYVRDKNDRSVSQNEETKHTVHYHDPDGNERRVTFKSKDADDARNQFKRFHPLAANGRYKPFKVEKVDESLTKSAEAGDWIRDFINSDNPRFDGKSKKKRTKMALAAYYAKQRS